MTSSSSAALVLSGGRVFDGTGAPPVAASVAVRDGCIVAVGNHDDVADLIGPATEVVDVGGGLITPGFHDAHVHPVYAGVRLAQCNLSGVIEQHEAVATVEAYANGHKDQPWILGGGWSMATFVGGTPTKDLLDAVVPDRPVFLPNRDGHGAWVNSVALRLAGISRATPDPADGRIERDPDGEPSGTLHEGAMSLVSELVPRPGPADYDRAIDAAQAYLFTLGITGWQDAIVGDVNGRADNLDAYLRAEDDGRLRARVVGALWWDRHRGADQIPELLERRATAPRRPGGRFAATSIKIMQDGIVENFTAALTQPYLDDGGCATDNAGISFVEPKALCDYVTRLDSEGFQVHFHALGDRAVREALDAIEAARRAHGMNDLRHHLAHLQVVHPDDVPRFAALGALANMQPLWACHEPQMDELTIPFLGGSLAAWQYRFGDLARAGATLVGGSDWSVSSPDVMWGAHVAVNRTSPPQEWLAEQLDHTPPAFLPDQRLTLAQALAAYSSGSAFANHLDDVVGTVSVGKAADLAVLDRDPFAGAEDEIAHTRVRRTYIDGEEVFRLEE
jgi:predicted amidohydrolase YtcJ